MAVSKVADRAAATAANATAATTLAVAMATAGSISINNYLVLRCSVNNTGTNGVLPTFAITDPRSNTWTILPGSLADPGAASAGVALFVAVSKVANSYTNADSITLTFGPTSAGRNAVVEEWSGVHLDVPFDYVELLTDNQRDAETDDSGWITPYNATKSSSSTVAHTGTKSIKITYTGSNDASGNMSGKIGDIGSFFPVVAGRLYYLSAWFRADTTTRVCWAGINFFDVSNIEGGDISGAQFTSTSSGWVQVVVFAMAPVGAVNSQIELFVSGFGLGGTGIIAGESHYYDDVSFGEVGRTTSGTATPTNESFTPATVGSAVYASVAVEGPQADTYTEDADTLDGSWVALTRQGGVDATATNNTTVEGGYKIVTGLSTQVHGATITSRDWCSLIFSLRAATLYINRFKKPYQAVNRSSFY